MRQDEKEFCDKFFTDPRQEKVKRLIGALVFSRDNCWLCSSRKAWAKTFRNPFNKCDSCLKIDSTLKEVGHD